MGKFVLGKAAVFVALRGMKEACGGPRSTVFLMKENRVGEGGTNM